MPNKALGENLFDIVGTTRIHPYLNSFIKTTETIL